MLEKGGKFKAIMGSDKPLRLTGAIMIYGDSDSAYATYHSIHIDANKQPSLLEGHPLTAGQIGGLVQRLGRNAQIGTFLSENVLSVGMDSLIWWVKPAVREIHFACSGDKGIGEESGMVPCPGLVFAVVEGVWYVFAVKGSKRPTESTQLYQAPHFNVWAGGKICTGNVKLPEGADVEDRAAWEKAYFGSRFSHPNVPELVKYKGGAYTFWRDMLDGKFTKFPSQVLVKEAMTLGGFISKASGVSK
ncbi:PRTRC system protein B [Geomonas subterranea]|uniref:PRTRC system protein B n=1 Tax=Geomonas subterranea TaxID=2847989 RepID=UPI001CD5F854|nr:PRTRC system protein B [Geomonas fuzhouensis]